MALYLGSVLHFLFQGCFSLCRTSCLHLFLLCSRLERHPPNPSILYHTLATLRQSSAFHTSLSKGIVHSLENKGLHNKKVTPTQPSLGPRIAGHWVGKYSKCWQSPVGQHRKRECARTEHTAVMALGLFSAPAQLTTSIALICYSSLNFSKS